MGKVSNSGIGICWGRKTLHSRLDKVGGANGRPKGWVIQNRKCENELGGGQGLEIGREKQLLVCSSVEEIQPRGRSGYLMPEGWVSASRMGEERNHSYVIWGNFFLTCQY